MPIHFGKKEEKKLMLSPPPVDSAFETVLKSVGMEKKGAGNDSTWELRADCRPLVQVDDFDGFQLADRQEVDGKIPLVGMRIPEADPTQVRSLRNAGRLTESGARAVDKFIGPLVANNQMVLGGGMARADRIANEAAEGEGARQLGAANVAADTMHTFLARTMIKGGNYPLSDHAKKLAAESGVPVGLVLHEFRAKRAMAEEEGVTLLWGQASAAKFEVQKGLVVEKMGEVISLVSQAVADGIKLPLLSDQVNRMGVKSQVNIARRVEQRDRAAEIAKRENRQP
jgi:hypothetical protein